MDPDGWREAMITLFWIILLLGIAAGLLIAGLIWLVASLL